MMLLTAAVRFLGSVEIISRKHALEIFRGTLPPQRSEEAQGRKMSSVRREHDFQSSCREIGYGSRFPFFCILW